jgi:hypothetical protein
MKAFLAIVGVLVTLFFAIILGTFLGGIVGWCVNLMFPVVNVALNQVTGLALDAFDMGAVLGFVGGFFKTATSSTSK